MINLTVKCVWNIFVSRLCAPSRLLSYLLYHFCHSLYLLQTRIYTLIFPCGDRPIHISPDSPTRLVSWHENQGVSKACCFFAEQKHTPFLFRETVCHINTYLFSVTNWDQNKMTTILHTTFSKSSLKYIFVNWWSCLFQRTISMEYFRQSPDNKRAAIDKLNQLTDTNICWQARISWND